MHAITAINFGNDAHGATLHERFIGSITDQIVRRQRQIMSGFIPGRLKMNPCLVDCRPARGKLSACGF